MRKYGFLVLAGFGAVRLQAFAFSFPFKAQNFDTKVLACQRAMTARIRIRTIHIISALGIKEFAQYAL